MYYKININLIPIEKKAQLIAFCQNRPGYIGYCNKTREGLAFYQVRCELTEDQVSNIRLNTNALAVTRIEKPL